MIDYDYRVQHVARVIDGDTMDLDVDLGFYATLRIRVRLIAIDTPEVYGQNAVPEGEEARQAAIDWLTERDGRLGVRTEKLQWTTPVSGGGFGRWEGEIYDRVTGEKLAEYLAGEGHEK